jgi:hypothetical protein
LIEIDGAHDLVGKLVWRTSSNTVDARHFGGYYAFVFSGANKNGTVGQGGTFALEASGDLSNGTVNNGTFDTASDNAFTLGSLFSGSLVVTDQVTGRSIVTFNLGSSTLQYVVYPPSLSNEVAFLEIDNQNVTSGLALQFSSIPGSSTPSLSGQFAFLAGESTDAVRRTVSGALTMGSVPTGRLDIDESGTLSLDTALQASSFSVTSLYGRGQLQFQAGGYNAKYTTYIVDSSNVLFMETDGKGVLTGLMQKQY